MSRPPLLRAPSRDEVQEWHVVGYQRLLGQDFPAIQRAIERMHADYPGSTMIEDNSIGLAIIKNLRLPEIAVIARTTTQASRQAMLTEIEFLLQDRTLKIHRDFDQLLSELANYRLPDTSITQDSVVALGLAVANKPHASASRSAGGINRELFYELNGGLVGPPLWWLDRQKITADGPAFGLIPGHRAPDKEHGGVRYPYQAELDEVPGLLAEGWAPIDPTILEKFGFRIDTMETVTPG